MARRMYVVGNWKMHGTGNDIAAIQAIASGSRTYPDVDVALCVPATLIERAARAVPELRIGAQDVHHAEKGAHSGCISAAMLRDSGARLVIVGHSERRQGQHESDEDVRMKAEAALAAGLDVIVCVGESLDVRESGRAVVTVERQLAASLPRGIGEPQSLAVAYEPIWAIGTGKVPAIDEIAELHGALRDTLADRYGEAGQQVRILYGGSVKGSNAGEIFGVEDVDGALVGGASLQSADFLPIVQAAAEASAGAAVEAQPPIA